MAENTKTHCFYRLLKLHTKKNPHEYHQEFLEDCKAKDVIPHGLMHHKTAHLDTLSDEFQNNWMNILNRASRELRDPAPVVQTMDGAIRRINHYPLDNSIGFAGVYPLDSDLSGG